MTALKTKTRVDTRLKTMARTALLSHAAHKVADCFAKYTGTNWMVDRLDTWLKHELVLGFSLVGTANGQTVAVIKFTINWWDHRAYISGGHDTVNVAGMQNGDDYVPVTRIVGVVDNFLREVVRLHPNVTWEGWHTRNSAAEHALGYQRYAELLGVEFDPERRADSHKRWDKIADDCAAAPDATIAVPGLSEAGLKIWGKKS